MTAKQFYRAFEDRHRGPRELIKARQKVYLPFIEPLKTLYSNCPALDLGCGRGEWLEVLLENDFEARGVDLDEGMLEACNTLKLPAEQGEALEILKSLADESLVLISGFHIAEHIPFANLQRLVHETLRVLKPAGLLILETPNPENLVVGTSNFYLDPTHERPIPPLLLSFLVEHTGFARFKLLRLQESPDLAKAEHVGLMNVLGGVSPDYAIVAQKIAPADQIILFDTVFGKEYGLALDMLANRYDAGLQRRFLELTEKLDSTVESEMALFGQTRHAEDLATKVHSDVISLELRIGQVEVMAAQLRLQLEEAGARIEKAESRSLEADQSLKESAARVLQAELAQAAVKAINETLQQQAQQATSELLERYKSEQRLELSLERVQEKLSHTERQLSEVEQDKVRLGNELQASQECARQLDTQLRKTQEQLNQSLANAHYWYLQANAHEAQVKDVLNSISWRVTKPLRLLMIRVRRVRGGLARLARRLLRPFLTATMRWVMGRPELKRRLTSRLRHHPVLFQHLRLFALNRGLLGPLPSFLNPQPQPAGPVMHAPDISTSVQPSTSQAMEPGQIEDLSMLSPRARQIYMQLKNAIREKGAH